MPGTGGSRKRKPWEEEKERLMSLSQTERRLELAKGYIPLEDIPTLLQEYRKTTADVDNQDKNNLYDKVSLYKGDITQLEVDAIVNAANSSLLGGGGVDGCIHRAAGSNLIAECRTLGGCPTGQAKITCGYQLPAKYVIHTVGPIARGHLSDSNKEDLKSCYKSSLALAKENNIRSIAFPCISTGIYGFPNEPAANIALNTAKEWLSENRDWVERIIFCVFLEVDFKIYKMKLKEYFPKAIVSGDMKEPGQEESDDAFVDTRDPDGEESDVPDDTKEPGGEKSDQDDMAGSGQDADVPDDMKEPGGEESDVPDDMKEPGGEESEPSQPPQTYAVTPEDQPSEAKQEKNQHETEAQEEMITDSQPHSQIMESQDTVTCNSPDPICESQSQNSVTSEPAGCEIPATDVEMNSQSTEIPTDNNQLGEMDEEKDKK